MWSTNVREKILVAQVFAQVFLYIPVDKTWFLLELKKHVTDVRLNYSQDALRRTIGLWLKLSYLIEKFQFTYIRLLCTDLHILSNFFLMKKNELAFTFQCYRNYKISSMFQNHRTQALYYTLHIKNSTYIHYLLLHRISCWFKVAPCPIGKTSRKLKIRIIVLIFEVLLLPVRSYVKTNIWKKVL